MTTGDVNQEVNDEISYAVNSTPLQQLQQALEDERQALIAHDAQALLTATEQKLQALQILEAQPPIGQADFLQQLADRNRANGQLLARRRREIDWALRHLGRSEGMAYDASGHTAWSRIAKPLAVV